MPTDKTPHPLDDRVRALLSAGDTPAALREAVRGLGPDVLGFLDGVLRSRADAEEVFAVVLERFWKSLATFEWRCSLRTWAHVIAGREAQRFRRGERRHVQGRVAVSELADVIAAVRTETWSRHRSERELALSRLRDELPEEDRALLVLRVDRGLAWDDIALAFTEKAEACSGEEQKREAARLRKRFQILKQRLADRARAEGLMRE
jgi:RNA polymerase sigma-70 factor, ECF subfamily